METKSYHAIRVTFIDAIQHLDEKFDDTEMWGISNTKDWIDSYESSRFTQITDCDAIITSEYNLEHIIEALYKERIVKSITLLPD